MTTDPTEFGKAIGAVYRATFEEALERVVYSEVDRRERAHKLGLRAVEAWIANQASAVSGDSTPCIRCEHGWDRHEAGDFGCRDCGCIGYAGVGNPDDKGEAE